jgi:hypothetical protein
MSERGKKVRSLAAKSNVFKEEWFKDDVAHTDSANVAPKFGLLPMRIVWRRGANFRKTSEAAGRCSACKLTN